jgi:hypothetical protein
VEDDEEVIQPAEAARDKRRDHRAAAAERAGMRTGLAKQFKQVLDTQVKRAAEAEREIADLRSAERLAAKADRGRRAKHPHLDDPDAG